MDRRQEIINMLKRANPAELRRIMKRLDREGRNIILDVLDEGLTEAEKRHALAAIQDLAGQADAKVRDWVLQGVTVAYVDGVRHADKTLRRVYGATIDLGYRGKLTAEIMKGNVSMRPHIDAVNALTSDAYLDFANTMSGYVRGAEHILNDAMRRRLQDIIAGGRLEGASPQDIKRRVREELADRGFTVLIDRGGREWKLDAYSEMLVRTHLLRANAQATTNRAMEYGVDIVEISTHTGACKICQQYEGKKYSLSGTSKNYPRMPITLPIHPNCRHSLLLRPDLSDEDVQN